jgi:hypothetical protein
MWTSADLIAAGLLCKGGQELNNSAATQHPIPTHILSTEGMRFTSFLLHNLQIASEPCIYFCTIHKNQHDMQERRLMHMVQ